MDDDFEKNWTEGTFPGWPVSCVIRSDLLFATFLPNKCVNNCRCSSTLFERSDTVSWVAGMTRDV